MLYQALHLTMQGFFYVPQRCTITDGTLLKLKPSAQNLTDKREGKKDMDCFATTAYFK
ncbi:MAG: hypothetical protein GX042_04810 [Bacteroidales bacterium]|jgi:hypothetical protein|nr:hypothetical protein [Bacteroidales bacterium]